MSRATATRYENKANEGKIYYEFSSQGEEDRESFVIQENTNLVDGIGGVTWDGALILCQVMESIYASRCASRVNTDALHVVELGCGTGLCGIVAAKLGFNSTLTDRCADLARLNVSNAFPEELNTNSGKSSDIQVYAMPWESSTVKSNVNTTITDDDHITAVELVQLRGKADIIMGAEITCLRKHQGLLTDTIVQLCAGNPAAIVLLSFDGTPPPNDCLYEKEMMQRMTENGFQHSTVCAASCEWITQVVLSSEKDAFATKVSKAYIQDHSNKYRHARNRVSFPGYALCTTPTEMSSISTAEPKCSNRPCDTDRAKQRSSTTHETDVPPPIFTSAMGDSKPLVPPCEAKSAAGNTSSSEETAHHIVAFYRPSAVRTCRTCQQQYFTLPGLNAPQACRRHSGLFVCRRHPGDTRCSINGLGDGLGYYGNGQDGWKAEFWDCCGSEDANAEGCCTSVHIPY